jgi:hypothetical protein
MSENTKVFTVSAEDYRNNCCYCSFLLEVNQEEVIRQAALPPSERKGVKIRCCGECILKRQNDSER